MKYTLYYAQTKLKAVKGKRLQGNTGTVNFSIVKWNLSKRNIQLQGERKQADRGIDFCIVFVTSAYYELLQRIGLGTTLENRRVQDMLITINACFQGTAPTCIKELVKMRNNKYDLRGNNTLSLPKVNTTKYGLNSFRYFAAKQWNSIPNELRLRAGGLEFNKQVRNIQFQLSNFVILDARYFIFLHFYVHISFFLS